MWKPNRGGCARTLLEAAHCHRNLHGRYGQLVTCKTLVRQRAAAAPAVSKPPRSLHMPHKRPVGSSGDVDASTSGPVSDADGLAPLRLLRPCWLLHVSRVASVLGSARLQPGSPGSSAATPLSAVQRLHFAPSSPSSHVHEPPTSLTLVWPVTTASLRPTFVWCVPVIAAASLSAHELAAVSRRRRGRIRRRAPLRQPSLDECRPRCVRLASSRSTA